MKFHFQRSLLLLSVCISTVGCSSSEPADSTADKTVFVDTKTMVAVVQPVAEMLPAVNPETGERTLMPGLYCPECSKWYPVPPPEQINRRPDGALCPKTRTPLTVDGPWPIGGAESSGDDR